MKKDSQKPDWGRFGLSTEQQRESAQQLARENPDGEEVFDQHTESEKNELFAEDQVREAVRERLYRGGSMLETSYDNECSVWGWRGLCSNTSFFPCCIHNSLSFM